MSVEPRSRRPEILICGSDFRSVECDDWKLEAPGVREVLERVCVASSSSLIARRTEFIHETNRIRGDYNTGIITASWQFGELIFYSKSDRCTYTVQTNTPNIQDSMLPPTQVHVQPLVSNRCKRAKL